MLRVELGEEVSGKWKWRGTLDGRPLSGVSREPLLDACREFKRMGAHLSTQAGLFRWGREAWDLRTTVGYGAGLTVEETVSGPRFRKFKAWASEETERAAEVWGESGAGVVVGQLRRAKKAAVRKAWCLCKDCGVETAPSRGKGEFYMVRDFIWQSAGMAEGFLCIGCLEDRLGRTLVRDDFTEAMINDGDDRHDSERLRDRLRR